MKTNSIGCLATAIVLLAAPPLAADNDDDVDAALLEDLGAQLLAPPTRADDALDERLLRELGEDIGQRSAKPDGWLTKVVTHMETAQSILEKSQRVDGASSAQGEALKGIDAMIAELTERKSKCSGGQCDKPGSPKPGKKPSSSGKAGKSPAKSAPSSTNSNADLSTELAVAGELVKDLWGQLPERQREQILQPLSEEFLPKYASEIEAYFRALAEPKRNAPEAR